MFKQYLSKLATERPVSIGIDHLHPVAPAVLGIVERAVGL
jgi:hypothetical protein